MKKIISWIIIGVLIIALGVVLFLLIRTNTEKNALSSTMDDFKNSTIATQVAEFQTSQNTLASMEAAQTELQNQVDVLQAQLVNAQTTNDTLVVENDLLKKTLYCADKESFTPDYASNMAMSIALKTYVSNITGLPIQDATWEVFWSGANSSLHKVYIHTKEHNRLKAPYIVFFIEQGMDLKRGVFDITNQCWLDFK
jgi:regulator of replication initiation timing